VQFVVAQLLSMAILDSLQAWPESYSLSADARRLRSGAHVDQICFPINGRGSCRLLLISGLTHRHNI
jgi:hypothetical protein